MRLRLAASFLVLVGGQAGCGGAVVPSGASDAGTGTDAPLTIEDGVLFSPFDAGQDSGLTLGGTGACTIAYGSADGGVPDGGGVAWPGTATWQTVGIVEDLIGVEIRCLTEHEDLRITVAPNQGNGLGTLQTYWGLDGTGSGKAACMVQFSAAPWIPSTSGVVGLYACAPMSMSWGGTVTISGTVSAK